MKKRKGFTVMEIALVALLIAILSTGSVLGFTTYNNAVRDIGALQDFNALFLSMIHFSVVDKQRLPNIDEIREHLETDGYFVGKDKDVLEVFEAHMGIKQYTIRVEKDKIIVLANNTTNNQAVQYKLNTANNEVIVKEYS